MRAARQRPDKVALVLPGTRLTYRELAASALAMSRGLARLGVRPGDHVGVLLPNSPEFVAAVFGIAAIGAVVVPINTRYRAAGLRFMARHADLVAIVTTDSVKEHADFAALLREALPGLGGAGGDPGALEIRDAPALRFVLNLGSGDEPGLVGREAFESMAGAVPATAIRPWQRAVAPQHTALLLYTSGTTSEPKGCILTHATLAHKRVMVARRFEMTAQDRSWVPLPLYHVGGLMALLFTFERGGTLLTAPHFEPRIALEMIQAERATVLYPGFPAVTLRLLDVGLEHADLGNVRAIINAGPLELWRRVQDMMPHAVQVKGYGLTEACGMVSYGSMRESLESRATTSGALLPGYEVRIVDRDTGEPLPPEGQGEILVRGSALFEGYYKDPEATRAILDEEGFLHTGDIGRLDANGRLVYEDRAKDMLKVGGENVAPAEIESCIASHPLVAQAQVVGAADDRLGEVPAAFVELLEGSELTEQELIEYCQGQIGGFKVPRVVRFVTHWPMTGSSLKVQKARLREQLARELQENA